MPHKGGNYAMRGGKHGGSTIWRVKLRSKRQERFAGKRRLGLPRRLGRRARDRGHVVRGLDLIAPPIIF